MDEIVETVFDAQTVFPEFDVVMSGARVRGGNRNSLYPNELSVAVGAAPCRSREFAAGRQAARQALVRLGAGAGAIPRCPDRLPRWPEGVVGSISHSRTLAAAAVTRDDRLSGLGLDLETPDIERPDDIARLTMTPDECSRIECGPDHDRACVVARVFSCKEAVFKAVYPAVREAFDFADIEIDPGCSSGAFTARSVSRLRSAERIGAGRGQCMILAGHIVSVFVVESRNFRDLGVLGTDKTIDGFI